MSDLYYRFYQRMDEPAKIVGVPVMEFLVSVGLASFFLINGQFIFGLLLSVAFMMGIRSLKQGKGQKWLTALAYWYLPDFVLPLLFFVPLKVTPPSYQRLWLS